MKPHTITTKDLRDWQQSEKVIFASSTKEDKKLYCTLTGCFEVWHGKERVLETIQVFDAVMKYNSITSKN